MRAMRRRDLTHSFTQKLPDGREMDVTVEFSGYYDPGNTYGPMDNCYPPEGEVNINTVTSEADGEMDFEEWATKYGLSEKDVTGIKDRLMEVIQEGQEGDEPW